MFLGRARHCRVSDTGECIRLTDSLPRRFGDIQGCKTSMTQAIRFSSPIAYQGLSTYGAVFVCYRRMGMYKLEHAGLWWRIGDATVRTSSDDGALRLDVVCDN